MKITTRRCCKRLLLVMLVIGLAAAFFTIGLGQEYHYDPNQYLEEYVNLGLEEVQGEMANLHQRTWALYAKIAVASVQPEGPDQNELIQFEHEMADIEMRATALLLRAFAVRGESISFDMERPFPYEIEIHVLRIKQIYFSISIVYIEIEHTLISIVVK